MRIYFAGVPGGSREASVEEAGASRRLLSYAEPDRVRYHARYWGVQIVLIRESTREDLFSPS